MFPTRRKRFIHVKQSSRVKIKQHPYTNCVSLHAAKKSKKLKKSVKPKILPLAPKSWRNHWKTETVLPAHTAEGSCTILLADRM